MDFEELDERSAAANKRKNRLTLIALFAMFGLPVLLAYLAFAFQWFGGAAINHGQLIAADKVSHIEDFRIVDSKGEPIHGREFETLYWWVLPIDANTCDNNCQQLNTFVMGQTYKGLGKENSRIKMLVISGVGGYQAPNGITTAYAEFKNSAVQPQAKTRSGKHQPMEANYLYLVDPIGNIFMRYPLIKDKKEAVKKSKDLRFDILHLFKYSRLG